MGFLFSGGQFTTIDYPPSQGDPVTTLLGINNDGQILGTGDQGLFIYTDGAFNTVVCPSDLCNSIYSIEPLGFNNSDNIVGIIPEVNDPGVSGDQGFLATPVPEPGLWPVLPECMICFVALAYRRKFVRPDLGRVANALK